MNKDIGAVFTLNEAETLAVVEPLHSTFCHARSTSFRRNLTRPKPGYCVDLALATTKMTTGQMFSPRGPLLVQVENNYTLQGKPYRAFVHLSKPFRSFWQKIEIVGFRGVRPEYFEMR